MNQVPTAPWSKHVNELFRNADEIILMPKCRQRNVQGNTQTPRTFICMYVCVNYFSKILNIKY